MRRYFSTVSNYMRNFLIKNNNKKKQHLDLNVGFYDIVHKCLIPYFQHWLNAGLKNLPDVDGFIWGAERGFGVIRD